MKRYRFLEEADAEFQEHIRYYDEQVAGLGDKFIADVENIITQIREYPESGARVSRNLRKRVLHVFHDRVRICRMIVDQVITSDPEVQGGAVVFAGTRVPLKNLIDYLEAGDSLEEFLDDFPSVTREQAVAALELAQEASATLAGSH